MKRFVQLRDELFRTHNRSGNELREEGDVETKIEDVFHRLYASAIDIDGIRDDLEYIERDTHRQDDRIHAETSRFGKSVADVRKDIKDPESRSEEVIDHVCEEIGVLKIG